MEQDKRTAAIKAAKQIYERIAGIQGVIKCAGEAAMTNSNAKATIHENVFFAMELLYRECENVIDAIDTKIISPLEDIQ